MQISFADCSQADRIQNSTCFVVNLICLFFSKIICRPNKYVLDTLLCALLSSLSSVSEQNIQKLLYSCRWHPIARQKIRQIKNNNNKLLYIVFGGVKFGREKIKYEKWKGMVGIGRNCNFKQDGQGNSHCEVDIWVIWSRWGSKPRQYLGEEHSKLFWAVSSPMVVAGLIWLRNNKKASVTGVDKWIVEIRQLNVYAAHNTQPCSPFECLWPLFSMSWENTGEFWAEESHNLFYTLTRWLWLLYLD